MGGGRCDAVELVSFGGEPAVDETEFRVEAVEAPRGVGVAGEPVGPFGGSLFEVVAVVLEGLERRLEGVSVRGRELFEPLVELVEPAGEVA